MCLAGWLNGAWMLKCAGESWAFRRALRRVARTQTALLQTILATNRDTELGARYDFGSIRTPEEYRGRVPLSTYEDYAPHIERIAAGKGNVLTRSAVELLEPTSGTTGGEKLIPYTADLRRQFQRAVSAWIANLFWHRPAVRAGRAYWSISPALGASRRSAGGIPIGFADDADYLGTLERWALDRLLVAPASVARLTDVAAFRYATLLYLLRAEDLALLSVWNPTFLTALLDPLEDWQERLCRDVRDGIVRPPPPLAGAPARFRGSGRRADRLASIFRSPNALAEKLQAIWPRLALISCWSDAAAARCLDPLRELFPAVEIQPKGLLATEGCVSFPLVDRPAPVLAVRSHFFEFEESAAGGSCRLAHELEAGGKYRVILTTGGGLYRYQLRDEVEVAGFEKECPLLRFLGKADPISDLVGEKLAEPHVRRVLDRLFAVHGLAPRFALLVPVPGRPARYRLYVQGPSPEEGNSLAGPLEAGLEENPHYRHAVRLQQLAAAEVQVLDPAGELGWLVHERRCQSRGQKLGNIKPAALDVPGAEIQ